MNYLTKLKELDQIVLQKGISDQIVLDKWAPSFDKRTLGQSRRTGGG